MKRAVRWVGLAVLCGRCASGGAKVDANPGLLAKVVDGVVGLGKWGLGWYFGAQIADRAFEQPRTVEPVVVQPEVVMVPSAPAP